MPIRRMTDAADVETMMTIVQQHNKIQGLPKEITFLDINDPSLNYNNVIRRTIEDTIHLDHHYHFGNFSNTGELLSFIRFKVWTDTDINQECWTAGSMFRNKNISASYTYGQDYFPDEVIDVHNHGVNFLESLGIKIGYTLSPNAIPGRWTRITSATLNDKSVLLHGPDRYKCDLVEEIAGGTLSKHEKFIWNVCHIPLSINQCLYRFTKIE